MKETERKCIRKAGRGDKKFMVEQHYFSFPWIFIIMKKKLQYFMSWGKKKLYKKFELWFLTSLSSFSYHKISLSLIFLVIPASMDMKRNFSVPFYSISSAFFPFHFIMSKSFFFLLFKKELYCSKYRFQGDFCMLSSFSVCTLSMLVFSAFFKIYFR